MNGDRLPATVDSQTVKPGNAVPMGAVSLHGNIEKNRMGSAHKKDRLLSCFERESNQFRKRIAAAGIRPDEHVPVRLPSGPRHAAFCQLALLLMQLLFWSNKVFQSMIVDELRCSYSSNLLYSLQFGGKHSTRGRQL